jgi:hypothetical protein
VIDAFVLDYVRRNQSVLPTDLVDAASAAGFRVCGDYELHHGSYSIVPFVSYEFAVVLSELLAAGRLRLRPTSRADYLAFSPRIASNVKLLPVRLEVPQ